MALFYINFKAIIKQKNPSEEIHTIEFSRRLEDEHWWDPLPQIGSTILIPFIEDGGDLPYSGTHAVDKTPCKVVDILHELNGRFSYQKTTVCLSLSPTFFLSWRHITAWIFLASSAYLMLVVGVFMIITNDQTLNHPTAPTQHHLRPL